MADSWTKLYTVCAEAIKPYCLTEFSLRWRCRCVHEMYGENAERKKRVSTRSARFSIQHLSPVPSLPIVCSHEGWRYKRAWTKNSVQAKFKSLVCVVREHREVFLLLVFVLTFEFSTQKQQQSPQQLLNTQLTLQQRHEGSHLWRSPGHRHWLVHS